MFTLLRAAIKALVTLVVLVVVAYAGWRWGGPVFQRVHGWLGAPRAEETFAPSDEMAEDAISRYQRFSRGSGERELMVSGEEATSVLRYGVPGLMPSGLLDPTARFRDGDMLLTGRLVRRSVPSFPEMGGVVGLLPDTVRLEVEAELIPFQGGRETAVVVRRLEAQGVPVPGRFVPDILRALGRKDRTGLPADAILLPLPEEISGAYILGDSLHLVGRP